MKIKYLIAFSLLVLFSCSKEDKTTAPESQSPVVQEPEPSSPEVVLPPSIDNLSEGELVSISFEIPASSTIEDYQIIDDKGRVLSLNETLSANIEGNTMVSLVNKNNGYVAYIGYFPDYLNDSGKSSLNGKSQKVDLCDFSRVLGLNSTAEILIGISQTKYANMFFGSTNRNQLYDIYNSNMPCTQYSEQQIEDITAILDEAIDAGLSITSETVFSEIKTAMSTVTGGIFTDCVDLVQRGFEEQTMVLIDFPQLDLETSLILYKQEDVNQPHVITEFFDQRAVGVVIDQAEPLNDGEGNWRFNLKVYNSLPIPFGVGVGTLIDGNNVLTRPISDVPEYFIGSNPSSIISIVKNGISCEGFIKNMHDNYYAITGDGTEIRANKFDISEIELVLNPTNNHVVFLGSNENEYVKSWHLLETMSVLVDYLAGFGDSNLDELNNSNQNNFSTVKYEVYKELTNILVGSDEFKNFISTASFDIEEAKRLIVDITTEYVGNLSEANTTSVIAKIRKEKKLPKLNKESSFVFWINLGSELVEKTIYFDAWTKLNELNKQAIDYKFYVPQDASALVGAVIDPMPDNGATNIPLNGSLSFSAGNNTPSDAIFRFYSGTNQNPTEHIDISMTENSYSNLLPNTTYYWKVETLSSNEEVLATSDTWSFTTTSGASTVESVINPVPENNSINQPLNGILSFSAGNNTPSDAEFRLRIQTTGEEEVNINLEQQTLYSYSDLKENSQYLWQIETLDNSGSLLATSPIWRFTTAEESPRTPANQAIDQPLNGTFSFHSQTGVVVGSKFVVSYYNSTDQVEQEIETLIPEANYSDLLPSTEYFWYVKVVSLQGATLAISDTWNFTTINSTSSQIYNGDLDFRTQEEVNNFGVQKYNIVNGNVFFSDSFNESITDLSSLSSLEEINGNLNIDNLKALETLEGLNNIKSISGDFTLIDNFLISSLNGLNNLESVNGNITIYLNASLTSMQGLNNLASVGGYLEISANPKIVTLEGLNNLESVDDALYIGTENSGTGFGYKNELLSNFCALTKLITSDGLQNEYLVENNAFNPTKQDIINGNCKN